MDKKSALVLIVLGVVFGALVLNLSLKLKEDADLACEAAMPDDCPHKNYYPLELFVGLALSLFAVGWGARYFFLPSPKPLDLSKLSEEERKVVGLIAEEEGAMFQNDLVEKSGFSRAKVTRILDKLEGKGLVVRRRRGMTNMVILKR